MSREIRFSVCQLMIEKIADIVQRAQHRLNFIYIENIKELEKVVDILDITGF